MKLYGKPLTTKEIADIKDEDIDFSDIAELDSDFWENAEIVKPDTTKPVTLRIKESVLEYFKIGGNGYQTRINAVLESYVKAKKEETAT